MGFGNGYSHTTHHSERAAYRRADGARCAMIFSNEMVAHVWAQQVQDFGRTSNGNFSFKGASLNSYDGFTVGYMLPTGQGEHFALITSESYSVSTTSHTSEAGSATRDKIRYNVPELRRIVPYLDALAHFVERGRSTAEVDKAMRDRTRRFLVEHAAKLFGRAAQPGESTCGAWLEEPAADGSRFAPLTGEELGATIARLATLPAASWEKAKRERVRLDAKAERERLAKIDRTTRARLVELADMPAHEFRLSIAMNAGRYSHFYTSLAKELWHLIKFAKANGYSAKRQAILKARRATVYAKANGYTGLEHLWRKRAAERQAISDVRAAMRVFINDGRGLAGASTRLGALDTAIRALDKMATHMPIFPETAKERLRTRRDSLLAVREPLVTEVQAEREAAEAERTRLYEERIAEQQRTREERARLDADAIAAWLRGEMVSRRISFDAESGGAAIRIIGETLETSHGASVPLAHAVKAFRFVKLCREAGKAWHRNGHTIRVGHFQIDSITAEGDFKAGCHNFTWPEIERVAVAAGVFDCPASDAAVILSSEAA